MALAGRLSWPEHHPIHLRAVGRIPGQDTYPGCGFSIRLGPQWEATDAHSSVTARFLFLPLSLPCPCPKTSDEGLRKQLEVESRQGERERVGETGGVRHCGSAWDRRAPTKAATSDPLCRREGRLPGTSAMPNALRVG